MNSDTDELACSDKLAFDSRAQAQASATTVAYQHGTKVKPYQCTHCQLWHLATDYDD